MESSGLLRISVIVSLMVAVLVAALSSRHRERYADAGGDNVTVVKRCRPKKPRWNDGKIDLLGKKGGGGGSAGSLGPDARPCEVYFTPNVEACDEGKYHLQKSVLRELRARGDASVDAVLKDFDLLPAPHVCKASFSDWSQLNSHPRIVATPEDAGQRGSPAHWAFCFVPPNSNDVDMKALEADVVRPSEERVSLLGGLTSERVEFVSLAPEGILRQACKLRRSSPETKDWLTSLSGKANARVSIANGAVADRLTFHDIGAADRVATPPLPPDSDLAIDAFADLFEMRVATGGRLVATPRRSVVALRLRFAAPPCDDAIQEVVGAGALAMPQPLRAALGGDVAAALVPAGVPTQVSSMPMLRDVRNKAKDAYESALAKARFARKAYIDAINNVGGSRNGIANWFIAVASPMLPVI